jgi:sarcosine oxidase delta subunit
MENLPTPEWFDPQKILSQVLTGKRTEDIAEELGTTRERLVYQLTTKAPEEWKASQLIRDIKRKEEAEDAIDDAKDLLELRKAEAKLKSAQWSLERVCRRIYGDVKEDQSTDKVSITLNIGIQRPGDDAKIINPTP